MVAESKSNKWRLSEQQNIQEHKKGISERKINEFETNSKNKNIRDIHKSIYEFKNGYQHRTNLVKDDTGGLLADSHNILNRWKNHFCQLLNVHGINDFTETELHTAEPLVLESASLL
jgi:hypothetical protein